MTAWTITALNALVDELEGDSRLGLYVDSVGISDRSRALDLPDFERHAIELIPGAITTTPRAVIANTEEFTVTVRLLIRVWDPTSKTKHLTSNNVTGGVGASEVGMLQFREDVANCLRKNDLGGLIEVTAVECDQMPSLVQVPSEERDTVIYETELTWAGRFKAYHDPALRS